MAMSHQALARLTGYGGVHNMPCDLTLSLYDDLYTTTVVCGLVRAK